MRACVHAYLYVLSACVRRSIFVMCVRACFCVMCACVRVVCTATHLGSQRDEGRPVYVLYVQPRTSVHSVMRDGRCTCCMYSHAPRFTA